ncbi:MAG TPA: aspartate kinase [Verrucomicrobia bacterium]|nr:aspartate kinase [Verrucomicrobiota bacterium]
MKVCKFGGSSVADAKQIGKVCDIVASDPQRRIVVVSAPGKRSKDDIKVTDLLIRCAETRLNGGDVEEPLKKVIDRFALICNELGVTDNTMASIERSLCQTVLGSTTHAGRYMDAVKAAGEDNCARLMAGELRRRGHDAQYVNPGDAGLLLSDEYGHARLLPDAYEKLSVSLAAIKGLIVFPGFFGYTPEGDVVTFSRGGSDVTGSILAAAVGAEVYENFTDVDAVFSADPRLVENAKPVKEITYREMRELSYAGFGVLHDEAIIPAVRAGIPICIKNTNAPQAPGTLIVPEHRQDSSRVVGIAASGGFCTVYVSKYLMNREIGFGRRLLQIFEDEGVSYEHTPSGIDNMSVILREDRFSPDTEQVVCKRILDELEADDVSVERGLALIMIVGEGMRRTVGFARKATKAFAEAEVNIEMMNQGSSEISIMFGVKAEDSSRALQYLHKEFFD